MSGGETALSCPVTVERILPEHLVDDALNLVVFGPGKGEACLVRLPDGRVGVVDGCRERDDPMAELLDSLRGASTDPSRFRLSFVALTHPHDDHYAGLGRLLQTWRGRVDEVWRNGYDSRYAEQLLGFINGLRDGKRLLPDEVSINGLRRVLEESQTAQDVHETRMQWLVCGKDLLSEPVHGDDLSIRACGPADRDMDEAARELTTAIRQLALGQPLMRVHDPNRASGAILIRWGKAGILLAGDLLCGDHLHGGWRNARRDIRAPVQVVSVAHHASIEAHDAMLWNQMNPRLAIVTPFKCAVGQQPPRPTMVLTLAQAATVALTALPAWAGEAARYGLRRRDSVRALPVPPTGRNRALSPLATPGYKDRHNAVAVALGPDGLIQRLVLAGQADVWDAME